jgi:hypothetical protein
MYLYNWIWMDCIRRIILEYEDEKINKSHYCIPIRSIDPNCDNWVDNGYPRKHQGIEEFDLQGQASVCHIIKQGIQ